MSKPFKRLTSADYISAYTDGVCTPSQALAQVIAEAWRLERETQPLEGFVILDHDEIKRQAAASTQRWASGKPLGPLDGVPVAVKDEFDIVGYPTAAGTRFRGAQVAKKDCTMVDRLRRAGAVLLGKTSMHEIGIGGTGINPGHLSARNPYDTSRFSGGSSSGSGVVVSAGLCPVAIGSDAGGSIRIPASMCGVYGLKPTFGRVPTTGGALLAWTLDHAGPLGASLQDLALFMDITAGADEHDVASRQASPYKPIGQLTGKPVKALRLAWSRAAADAAAPQIRDAFYDALEQLREAGAHLEEVQLEWGAQLQPVGYVTLVSEGAASQREWLATSRALYNADTRMVLAIGERISASEYLHAQRVRELIRQMFARHLLDHDAFLSPTTGCTGQPISKEALDVGEVNSDINAAVSCFTFAGNLTGYPAVTIPLGQDSEGMPMGLQLMSKPWTERALLNVAATLDPLLPGVGKPRAFADAISLNR